MSNLQNFFPGHCPKQRAATCKKPQSQGKLQVPKCSSAYLHRLFARTTVPSGSCSHLSLYFWALGQRDDPRKLLLPRGHARPSRPAVAVLRPRQLLPRWAALLMPSCWSELGEVHSDQLIPTDNKRGGSLEGSRGGGGGDVAEDGFVGAIEQPGSRRHPASLTSPCCGQATPGGLCGPRRAPRAGRGQFGPSTGERWSRGSSRS